MPVETPSVFAHVIQEHLELKRRNSDLDENMPIERYSSDDPFENHPLFKTEEQARIEETMDGEIAAPVVDAEPQPAPSGDETVENALPAHADEDSGIWSNSRDFDWGD